MRLVIYCLAFAITFPLFAQRHTAYGELGGNGLLLTANYERRFSPHVAGRIGFSFVEVEEESSGDTDPVVIVPLMVNYLTHPRLNHHLELGAGVTIAVGETSGWASDIDEDFSAVIGTATIGYRYQRPERGFVFRAGLTPFFDGDGIAPWAGVSFGYGW
jgi:hypothetical protein